jgi:hypothetical protein
VVVTQQEPAGDYGYDMAHQDMTHEDTTRDRTVRPPASGEPDHEREAAAGRPGPPDQGGDYGYDEAHSF